MLSAASKHGLILVDEEAMLHRRASETGLGKAERCVVEVDAEETLQRGGSIVHRALAALKVCSAPDEALAWVWAIFDVCSAMTRSSVTQLQHTTGMHLPRFEPSLVDKGAPYSVRWLA